MASGVVTASSDGQTEGKTEVKSRVILQQCLSAKLMVEPASDGLEAEYVQIGRGLIIYICFMKGADESVLNRMVKTVLNTRLSEGENGKRVSILDLPGDVMVIPQATLGGSLKGKVMQYHKNINKTDGLQLYTNFVKMCEDTVASSSKHKDHGTVVKSGTYGNRQVFSTETNGPYTHIIEF